MNSAEHCVSEPAQASNESHTSSLMGLGVLAAIFYLIHATYHILQGHWEHLLWLCHLSNVAIALGLLFRLPTLNAMGVLWLCLGLPLWIFDLCMGGEFIFTSLLTHVGGMALGLFGVYKLGFPRHAGWKSFVAAAAVQQLCRWITPAASNVNVAFSIWPGSERYFSSFAEYRMIFLLATLVLFVAVEFGFRRFARS